MKADNDNDINRLSEIYQKNGVCLFLGAGVSFTSSSKYKTYGWDDLLGEIQEELIGPNESKSSETFENPWLFADYLIDLAGKEEKFEALLIKKLINKTGGDIKNKRLPIEYLKQAETLKAVLSFCTEINYVKIHSCFKPNEKIKSILTLNYDWYLEAGATQKYDSAPFKPMSDYDSKAPENKLLVYHIHGYIPFDQAEKPRQPLVMSSNSYKKIYSAKKNMWAKDIIRHNLTQHSTVFIGISFNDTLLLQYIKQISEAFVYPHFLIGRKEDYSEELILKIKEAGIFPLWIEEFSDIPRILEKLYLHGLDKKKQAITYTLENIVKEISREKYWKMVNEIKK